MALVSDDDVVRYTAVAVLNCGQVVVVPDGRVGVVQSMAPVAIGDTATVKVKGIMSITTAAALTAGDVVGVHIANQTLLAAGAAGTTAAGTRTRVTCRQRRRRPRRTARGRRAAGPA